MQSTILMILLFHLLKKYGVKIVIEWIRVPAIGALQSIFELLHFKASDKCATNNSVTVKYTIVID